MSITIQSEINPDISVTVYPIRRYRGGNGYYFHKTDSDKAFSPKELKHKGMGEVVKELTPKALEEWDK